ncbi:Transthyretin-like family protein [Oesophagostomum dentatum]|uniref:Transthyretin-like family protein n=1 Tax=Oesophagostomum dentatum TaxID=61180 RepID=A0A0B1TA93_OESDE|nr:Transthyretin-like family protein [Oesophagostomum dentatum]
MLLLKLLCIAGAVAANSECIWAIGRLVCNKDQKRVLNAVVEVWDKDGPQNIRAIDALDPDDKAGLTVVDSEDGMFKVEGCASDIDWLGPIHINRPEFYFKIRHLCNSDVLEEVTVFPPAMKVFAPKTMDYFLDNPIVLDRGTT